jgi:uncharacterized repeat protein (TIGR03803 family)
MSTQPTDADTKASSNNFNRHLNLDSFAAPPAKSASKKWYVWALAFSFLLMAVPPAAHGQTFSVLYTFTSPADGNSPGSLTVDGAGNLYGTAQGGVNGEGIVYLLDPAGNKTVLYQFKQVPDGVWPVNVVRDSAGNLYGATYRGGSTCFFQEGCGTVFKLDADGNETILHRFGRGTDGRFPNGVIRDAAGNLYGTTIAGGVPSLCGDFGLYGCGTVFKVDASGKETILYRFRGGADGGIPGGGVILDSAGNLYGTTGTGGANTYGTVFRLDANGKFTVLHSFSVNEGCFSAANLLRDIAGNLYGTTWSCGTFGDGTVFKVAPSGKTTVLHTFTGGSDGGFPGGPVVQDKAGNLYGSATFGGNLTAPLCSLPETTGPGCGVVFKIDTTGHYTVLHAFEGTDGQWVGGVILDAAGNLYGTASDNDIPTGGEYGTVFKIEP